MTSPPVMESTSGTERPDALPKTRGQFSYSSDLWVEGMLWGATLRSNHARARIRAIDTAPAALLPGVHAVLTHLNVPGRNGYGLSIPDQPVLASGEIRYAGEPIAIVAAEELHIAQEALERIVVDLDELDPVTDPELALASNAPALHEGGNVIRHFRIRKGDFSKRADVIIRGTYDVGIQDQAALGPESALAIPTPDGGIELYVSTQCLYSDLKQVCASLDLPVEKVMLHLAGIGGAFGGKEDISVQIHCGLLAMATARPVKMVYQRDEAFVGHPHRHPARMEFEHGANRDGRVIFVKARILLDGGAYASTSGMVAKNAGAFAIGPYDVPNVYVDSLAVYTNNPPAGSMRGMGVPQVCFAYEGQMSRLARELGLDPVKIRSLNALREGSELATGQVLAGRAPVVEIIGRLDSMPLPPDNVAGSALHSLPGGVSNVTHGEGVRRGVGYAMGIKGICFSEGVDDCSTAEVRLSTLGGRPLVEVRSAAAEMGQGILAVQIQVARIELRIGRVLVLPADTSIGSAGSSSASRQTYMTGGAVQMACRAIRDELFARAAPRNGGDGSLRLTPDGVANESGLVATFMDLLHGDDIEKTAEFHHRRTDRLDTETGQGDAFVSFSFAGHRAVVDVDCDLGLVRVVELATVQDVGRVICRQGLEGQIEGGSAQGLGLAIMEEVRLEDGHILNGSFTDYLIPTIMDMPPVRSEILEFADHEGPLGIKGAGEAPTVSAGSAIIGAIEDASGVMLSRMPVRPDDIVAHELCPS